MKTIKYLLQFIIIFIFFFIFKILGPKFSSFISGKIFEIIGPIFRSKKIIEKNIQRAIPDINNKRLKKIENLMWNNYGRVFAEYIFMKDFRSGNLSSNIKIEGYEILKEIKKKSKQVVFVSGHFANFELMAMYLDKSGINLSAIYRPLNNPFLNPFMERIRKKYICQNQVKKGIGGMKKLISLKKKNYSTALMIDQRVSQGILSNFFNEEAFTTTIPAQLVKKFDIPIIPIYIERTSGINFKMTVSQPLNFSKNHTEKQITDELNRLIEKMIMLKPEQWIWSHNRWK